MTLRRSKILIAECPDHEGLLAHELLRLWLLRILIPLGGLTTILRGRMHNDNFMLLLGLPPDIEECSAAYLQRTARKMHAEAESLETGWLVAANLRANSQLLADLLGLDETARRLLEFAIILHNSAPLDDCADLLGALSNIRLFEVLSCLLDQPVDAVRKALSSKGRLSESGLLTVDACNSQLLLNKLDLLSTSFAQQMLTELENPGDLLREMIHPASPSSLTLDDFSHLDATLKVLIPLLRRSLTEARLGVNLLIHGAPGTGKSELARVVATELNRELFEVSCEDTEGDPVSGERRLRSYRAAQSFLAQRQVLVLFDEVEDVFNDGNELWGRKSTAQSRKAWMNRALESNPVPSLWLCNTVDGIDAAFLRRFDMVIEMPVPPTSQRERIIRAHCGDLVDQDTIACLAEADGLTPAVVTRAASVIRLIQDDLPPHERNSAMTRVVNGTLRAQGWKTLRDSSAAGRPAFYDPRFINTDADLNLLAERMLQHPVGSLCLYGPSGTGKTAFGQWLADYLQRPLLCRRVSDLLGPYVGQTEANIAACFREAHDAGAVLLIDEVDSFLQGRRQAMHSWQVTQVNEMLTQMESYAGVFIASTNLIGQLDQATLRRFDVKLRFDYLQSDKAREMLRCQCAAMALPAPSPAELDAVGRLSALTPGDFAVARRQARLCGVANAADLLRILAAECALKEDGQRRAIGFV